MNFLKSPFKNHLYESEAEKSDAPCIFLIEDDVLYLHGLAYYLNKVTKYKIHCYSSGDECLKHMDLQPSIVIVDYLLNGENEESMNGLEILSKLKDIQPNVAIIMLSAQKRLDIAIKAINAGAFTYVIKDERAFSSLHRAINLVLGNKISEESDKNKIFFDDDQ